MSIQQQGSQPSATPAFETSTSPMWCFKLWAPMAGEGDLPKPMCQAWAGLLAQVASAGASGKRTLRVVSTLQNEWEFQACALAVEQGAERHLLVQGQTALQRLPHGPGERWVSLPEDDASSQAMQKLMHTFTLSVAHVLVVLGDEPDWRQEECLDLLAATLRHTLPVVWVKPGGEVRLFDPQQMCAPDPATSTIPLQSMLLQAEAGVVNSGVWQQMFSGPAGLPALAAALQRFDAQKPAPELSGSLWWLAKLHDLPLNLLACRPTKGGWEPHVQKKLRKCLRTWNEQPPYLWEGDFKELGTVPPTLETTFNAADTQANRAAGAHRAGVWCIHALAAFAVFAAIFGAVDTMGGGHGKVWPIAEVAALLAVVLIYFGSRSGRFHDVWLRERYLAEQLRYGMVGRAALVCPPAILEASLSMQANSHQGHGGKPSNHQALDELRRLQRAWKQDGLPQHSGLGPFEPGKRLDAIGTFVTGMVGSQVKFHFETKHTNHHAAHHLHLMVYACFITSLVAAVAHFVVHSPYLLIATGGLPALAAALHGISTKLELGRIAASSEFTHQRLSELQKIKSAGANFLSLHRWVSLATEDMAAENASWRQLIGHQEADIPG